MLCRTVFFLFETVDLTFGGVLHIIRLHLRFSAVCVISRKEICQTVLKFFGHKNSAGSASTEGCEPLQMTRKKSSKFSADASCPISAGGHRLSYKTARRRADRGESNAQIFL